MADKELAQVQAGFGLPFDEQIAFFRQKVRIPTATYKDMQAHQHDQGFVVAGAMKADLLQDLKDAVDKAIAEGETLAQFRARFSDIVQTRGWTGWTGSDSAEGVAWRTRVIYQTNLRTSHAAGRWQQMTTPEMLQARPYWQYRHTTRDNPRLKHQRMNNKVLPAQHTWWQTNYPPNGWGCGCYVRTLSDIDLQAQGLTVDSSPTGNIASHGWTHAHGSTWHPNLDKYDHRIAKQLVADNMRAGVFERWIARMYDQRDALKQDPEFVALDKLEQNKVIRLQDKRERFAVAVMTPEQKELLDVDTQTVYLSEFDALKQAISREGNRGFDASSYGKVQRVLDDAVLIVRQIHKPTQTLSRRTLWVEGYSTDETGKKRKSRYAAVLHQTEDGTEVYLKSYRLDNSKAEKIKKRGEVLFEKSQENET